MDGFELGNDGPRVIVVGIDGTSTSMRAGAYAAGLARRQSAKLVVVFVRTVPAMAGFAFGAVSAYNQTTDEVAQDLREQITSRAESMGLVTEFETVTGDAFTELMRIAERVRADALVVGASKRPDHRLVGSLAVRLVRAAKWPVTVVP